MGLSHWVEGLTMAGAEGGASAWDARRVKLVNGLALLSILMSWLSLPAAFLDGKPEALPINLMTQLAMFGVLSLNKRGQALLAASAMVGFSHLAVSGQIFNLGAASGVQYWLIPIQALPMLMFPARHSTQAFGFSLGIFLTFLAVNIPYEYALGENLSWLFAHTLSLLSLFALTVYTRKTTLDAERRVDEEQARADRLLDNMLPSSISQRLLSGERPAERQEDVTVLFADLVHFTELAQSIPAEEVVRLLDRIFSAFDELVEARGLEKIKTIGDAYMVAAGAPEPMAGHTVAAASLALEMRQVLTAIEAEEQVGLALRLGLHSGPVVAGVIGRRRYAYDLWGDVVNVAARLEESSLPGRIQISMECARRLEADFVLEDRGEIALKGKGLVRTCWLVAHREARSGAPAPRRASDLGPVGPSGRP